MALGAEVALLLIAANMPPDESADSADAALIECAPSTYDAALACLDAHLSPEMKLELACEDGPVLQHIGLGTLLRNFWELRRGGPLLSAMRAAGFTNPEDMSATILRGYSARLRGLPFDLRAEAARYRRYWAGARQRVNLPLSACAHPDAGFQIAECWRDGNGMIYFSQRRTGD